MEFGTIEREIRIEASPEVVFEVISSPEHLQEWWADEAELDSAPGGRGTLRWARGTDQEMVVPITVVETFEVVPSGAATVLRMTETGFREKGWEIAVLEEQYRDHGEGWDHYIPRLGEYVLRLVAPR